MEGIRGPARHGGRFFSFRCSFVGCANRFSFSCFLFRFAVSGLAFTGFYIARCLAVRVRAGLGLCLLCCIRVAGRLRFFGCFSCGR